MTEKTTVIVLRESFWQSVASDAFTLVMAWALIIPGHYLGSDAMQWTGAVIFMLVVLLKSAGKAKRMTPDEAIAHIEAIRKGGDDA